MKIAKIVVRILPKIGSDPKDIEKRFNNELVNYAFYKNQVDKNADIRKAIMQRALLTTELAQAPQEKGEEPDKEYTAEVETFEDSDEDYL